MASVAGVAVATLLPVGGCGGPQRVKQPQIDAASAAAAAVKAYDTDGDGSLSLSEVKAAPALDAARTRLDADGNGSITAAEIAARVNAWKAMRTGLASVRCQVTLDGKPLDAARVSFEPEACFGTAIRPAAGETNRFGDVAPTVAPEDRPDPTLPGGMHFGLYTVRISKVMDGRETVPARYNTESVLGQEVSYDDPGIRDNNLTFRLTTGERPD